jgi:hypothetical protein
MADDIDVEVDDTTGDSSLEANDAGSESSSDTPADAPLKADRSSRDKANERIRDLIEQRNALASQLQAAQSGRPQQEQTAMEGVTDEGIDPRTFADGLMKRAAAQTQTTTQQAVAFQLEVMDVQKDPVMKSRVAQEHVSSLINQGIRPAEALEIYKDDLKTIKAEALEEARNRKEANAAAREGTTVAPTGRTSTPSGSFTWTQIESMPMDDYRRNQAEIKRQAAAGLIK